MIAFYNRTEVRWGELCLESYLDQEKSQRSVLCRPRVMFENMKTRITWWSEVFEMSYFEYRQNLCDISTMSRNRVRGVDIDIRDKHAVDRLLEIPGVIVLPTDDDDFYCPEVADRTRDLIGDATAVSWSEVYNDIGQDRCEVRPCDHIWGTNGYAVSGAALLSLWGHRWEVLDNHFAASAIVRSVGVERHTNEVLCTTYKSIASWTTMRNVVSAEGLSVLVPRLFDPQKFDVMPPGLHECYRQVQDLNCRLGESARVGFNG